MMNQNMSLQDLGTMGGDMWQFLPDHIKQALVSQSLNPMLMAQADVMSPAAQAAYLKATGETIGGQRPPQSQPQIQNYAVPYGPARREAQPGQTYTPNVAADRNAQMQGKALRIMQQINSNPMYQGWSPQQKERLFQRMMSQG